MRSLNEEITEILEKRRLWSKWNEHTERLSELIAKKQIKAANLQKSITAESHSFDELQTMSVLKIISTVVEDNEQKLSESQAEIAGAKLAYQEAVLSLSELEKERKMYADHRDNLGDVQKEYEELLVRKNKLVDDDSTLWTEELFEITGREIVLMGGEQELTDAIDAGEHVYYSLADTLKSLDKASNWSVLDLLDKGMVTNFMNHSQLDNAKNSLHRTHRRIRQFQDELIDVDQHDYAQINISEFLTAADNFFEEIIVAWLIYNRLREVTEKITSLQDDVSDYVNFLKVRRNEMKEERIKLSENRVKLLYK